ncbi:MAG: hypothetical protein RI885_435 [Actinomycetota bacterium]
MPSLLVETTECADLGPLVPLLDEHDPLLWTRRGFGLAGLGTALRLEFSGADRIADAAAAWRRVVAAAQVTDPVGLPGTGLIALGTFAFAESSGMSSVLVVPSVIVGRTGGRCWVTRIGTGVLGPLRHPVARPFGDEYRLTFRPGALGPEGYRDAVGSAIGRIGRREVSKVVLARDLTARLPAGADLRRVVADLALGYPDCWTFAIDGFVGSSPETLIGVTGGTVRARVLAGSAARGTDAASDQDSATALATSTKDLDEHEFAVQSVVRSLRPHSPNAMASEQPFALKLPNLWHLASDVDGDLVDGSSALDLVGALHPTAAVAGTPTDAALAVIAELEPFDRGRFAGPVGWVGANGDGEWAVAVRSAQTSPDGVVTAYAGAGIVAESVAERELVETRLKFRPIVEAFG